MLHVRRPTRDAVRLLLLAAGVAALVATMVASTSGVVILLGNSDRAMEQRADQLRQGDQIKALARQIRAQGKRLVECTTRPDLRQPPVDLSDLPASDCYARQQAAQGDVLGKPPGPLKPYIAAAAACGAAHPGNFAATLRCTNAAVADTL